MEFTSTGYGKYASYILPEKRHAEVKEKSRYTIF